MTTRAFGLALDLPLHLADGGQTFAKLTGTFRAADLTDTEASWLVTSNSSLRVGWRDYGEFVVTASPPATIAATLAGATEHGASLAIVLSVLPLCLPMFGLEPLHGSAVGVGDHLVLILGASQAGKTTTAAHLLARGHALAADDACAIDGDGLLWPGAPLIGVRDKELADMIPGEIVGPYDDKVVVAPDRCVVDPVRPAAVVVLEPADGADAEVQRLAPADAVSRLLAQVRAPHALAPKRRQAQLDVVARLADGPVGRLAFDKTRHDGAHVAAAIERFVS